MKLNKILTVGMIASTFMLTACSGAKDDMSKKDAKAEVEAYYKKIDPKTAKLKKDISNTSLNESEELPKIDKSYPYTVEGDGDINAEIFVSPEKAGNGKDGIINEIAKDFNSENQTINGKKSQCLFVQCRQVRPLIISQQKIMCRMVTRHQMLNGIISCQLKVYNQLRLQTVCLVTQAGY